MLETIKERGDLVLLRNKRAVVAETLTRHNGDNIKLYGEVSRDEVDELIVFLTVARKFLYDKEQAAYAVEPR